MHVHGIANHGDHSEGHVCLWEIQGGGVAAVCIYICTHRYLDVVLQYERPPGSKPGVCNFLLSFFSFFGFWERDQSPIKFWTTRIVNDVDIYRDIDSDM